MDGQMDGQALPMRLSPGKECSGLSRPLWGLAATPLVPLPSSHPTGCIGMGQGKEERAWGAPGVVALWDTLDPLCW